MAVEDLVRMTGIDQQAVPATGGKGRSPGAPGLFDHQQAPESPSAWRMVSSGLTGRDGQPGIDLAQLVAARARWIAAVRASSQAQGGCRNSSARQPAQALQAQLGEIAVSQTAPGDAQQAHQTRGEPTRHAGDRLLRKLAPGRMQMFTLIILWDVLLAGSAPCIGEPAGSMDMRADLSIKHPA